MSSESLQSSDDDGDSAIGVCAHHDSSRGLSQAPVVLFRSRREIILRFSAAPAVTALRGSLLVCSPRAHAAFSNLSGRTDRQKTTRRDGHTHTHTYAHAQNTQAARYADTTWTIMLHTPLRLQRSTTQQCTQQEKINSQTNDQPEHLPPLEGCWHL